MQKERLYLQMSLTFETWHKTRFPEGFAVDAAYLREAFEAGRKADSVKPRHAVGVSVLLTENGKLLLGKRKNNTAAGLLSTPGGRLELEETVEECAAREFFEETGAHIWPGDIDIVAAKKLIRYGDHYVMFYVHVTGRVGEIVNREPDKCEGWAFTSMLDFRPEECTEPTDVLAAIAERISIPFSRCDCYSRPHHPQCRTIRKV